MELTTQDINWIHERLVIYCKYLKIDTIPILTLNKRELKLIRDGIKDYNQINVLNKSLTMDKNLGFCIHKNKKYTPIIYINLPNQTALKGLHEYNIKTVKKRLITYTLTCKIGHIEETLIHELLHIKLNQSRHTKKFYQTVKDIYYTVNYK